MFFSFNFHISTVSTIGSMPLVLELFANLSAS
jgi:hypothetical protein